MNDLKTAAIRINSWPPETKRLMQKVSHLAPKGIFSTGIENSDPMVSGIRRNQLREAHDFYTHWESRLENIASLGIKWLRFGEGLSHIWTSSETLNFELSDKVIKKCKELDITLIIDFLHFGLPDWLHKENPEQSYFQNPHFPYAFVQYVRQFVMRYPDLKYFTPVNEPMVTASLSAKYGAWNEQLSGAWYDDRYFVKSAINISRAAVLAKQEIENIWLTQKRLDEPIFVQNESFEKEIAEKGSEREAEAERFNLRRFSCLDLIFGNRNEEMRRYLLEQGMSEADYEWFMNNGNVERTILGIDYYSWCVHILKKDSNFPTLPFSYETLKDIPYVLKDLIVEYFDRYPLPLLHTEANAWPQNAHEICRKVYKALSELQREGYPIVGMTWFGDELQIGWHHGLQGKGGREEFPIGLFYKGKKQPVADIFKQLAEEGFK